MNKKSIWDLEYKTFYFEIKTHKPIYVKKFAGSMLRGGFGHTLREVSCPFKGKECSKCMINSKCFYHRVFETKLDIPGMPNTATHPYIIQPEFYKGDKSGILSSFGLTLFDYAIENIPYFILAFIELGKRGLTGQNIGYKLTTVHDGDKLIYSDQNKNINTKFQTLKLSNVKESPETPSQIAVKFTTPLRIKKQGHYIDNINFEDLMTVIFRRCYYLAVSINHTPLEKQYVDNLIEMARTIKTVKSNINWSEWGRYSSRQKTQMKLGGITGEMIFEGDLSKFIPFLRLSEILNAGKNTSFGLGKIKIESM